jgi:hypothetical protein
MDDTSLPGRFDVLNQIGYLGRSLPKARNSCGGPPSFEGEKALRSHAKVLSTPAEPLSEGDRTFLVKFARDWSERHLNRFQPDFSFSLSGGSCVESKRRDGGLAAYLNGVVNETILLGGALRYQKKLLPTLDNLSQVERVAADHLLPALAERLPESTPQAIPVAIPERGWKMRIATKSPGSLVLLTHLFRKWISRGIRSDPAIQEVLSGEHRAAVESLIERFKDGIPTGFQVLSADLKTATDLISLEAYQAIWEGIRDSNPGRSLPKEIRRAVELAIGPQRVAYSWSDGSSEAITTKRGALMGLPSTWSFLCLLNLACWKGACDARHKSPLPVRICGDDLLGVAPQSVVRRYEERMLRLGAKFSGRAKHFTSPYGGTFTEEVFRLEVSHATAERRVVEVEPYQPRFRMPGSHLPDWEIMALRAAFPEERTVAPRVVWTEAFPTRGLLGTMKSASAGLDAPYWVTLGPALERLCEDRNPAARQKMLKVVHFAHPELFRLASQRGLSSVVHLPRLLGGFGIPRPVGPFFGPLPDNVFGRAAFALAYGSSWESNLLALSQPYSIGIRDVIPFRRSAEASCEFQVLQRVTLAKPGSQAPAGQLESPISFEEILESATTRLANATMAVVSPDALRSAPDSASAANPKLLGSLRAALYRRASLILRTQGGALPRKGFRHPPCVAKMEARILSLQQSRCCLIPEAYAPVLLRPGTLARIRPTPPPAPSSGKRARGVVLPEHLAHLIDLSHVEGLLLASSVAGLDELEATPAVSAAEPVAEESISTGRSALNGRRSLARRRPLLSGGLTT